MSDATQRIFPVESDWTPSVLEMGAEECLASLQVECACEAESTIAVDVRDVVHTWCVHWGFTGRDYDDIMRPYITGDWRKYDGLSSPVWRGKAKETGRELFDCEVSEQMLAYHPIAIAHDDDFRYQRGFLGSNWRFYRRAARCEFGEARALAMYAAVSTFGLPIYMSRKVRNRMRRRSKH